MKNGGRFLALFLAVATGLRWFWNYHRPISPDECYLALCGFVPSFAYFDGPGGTPWLVALGLSTTQPGGFGATFFWPVLAAIASVLTYFLVVAVAGRREGLAIAVLLNLLPVFNSAALSATSAMPLSVGALGLSLCAWHALESDSPWWWAGAGFFAALGLLFTYTAWFFLPVLALVLLASHRWRRKLAAPGFWIACVLPACVYLLLLRWNSEHGWVHFIGGTWETALSLDISLAGRAVVAAASGLSPFVLLAVLACAVLAGTKSRRSPRTKFVGLPAIAGALSASYAALRGWPMQTPGLLAAVLSLPLLALVPTRTRDGRWKTCLAALFLGAAVWTALTLPRPPTRPFIDAAVARAIGELRSAHSTNGTPALFVIAEDAPLAAALALSLPNAPVAEPGHPPVYTLESAAARSLFDLWPRYDQFVPTHQAPAAAADPFTEQDGVNPFVGRSALYVTTQKAHELPQAVTAAFTNTRLLAEVPAPDGRILRVYLCSDYQTMPL